jgi:hypothetical protein
MALALTVRAGVDESGRLVLILVKEDPSTTTVSETLHVDGFVVLNSEEFIGTLAEVLPRISRDAGLPHGVEEP